MISDFDAIVITSEEPYGLMWHTQVIYADYLSKNHLVIYINAPQKWKVKNLFHFKLFKNRISNNLLVINYLNVFPSRLNFLNEAIITNKLKNELFDISAKRILFWHFDSFRSIFSSHNFIKAFSVKRIYHVIDPFYHNPKDKVLAELADCIIVTSSKNNTFYSEHSKKVINIPQCVDFSEQKLLLNQIPKVKINSNYLVLLGTISDFIDFDWLISLTNKIKTKLVIIGKINSLIQEKQKWLELLDQANVMYLGVMTPAEFYPILKGAKVGLIIYKNSLKTQPSSPLKVLNYLISGLPVITNLDCEIKDLMDRAIYNVSTSEELTGKVEMATNNALIVNQELVDSYLNSVSLDNMIDKIKI